MLDAAWVAVGVAIAVLIELLSVRNPAKIPFTIIVPRVVPGVALHFVVWFVPVFICITLFSLHHPVVAFLWGSTFPHLFRIKDNRRVNVGFALRHFRLFTQLHALDVDTRLYCQKMIHREERKASHRAIETETAARTIAISRLYECYLLEIIQQQADHPHSERARGLRHLKDPATKCKLVLRYLGYREFFRVLNLVALNPAHVLPSWPVGERRKEVRRQIDRNNHRDDSGPHYPERRHGFGRRKLDDPQAFDMLPKLDS